MAICFIASAPIRQSVAKDDPTNETEGVLLHN